MPELEWKLIDIDKLAVLVRAEHKNCNDWTGVCQIAVAGCSCQTNVSFRMW